MYRGHIGDVVTAETIGRAVTTTSVAYACRIVLGSTLGMVGRVTVAASCIPRSAQDIDFGFMTVDALVRIGARGIRESRGSLEVLGLHLGLVTVLTLEAVVCGRGLST